MRLESIARLLHFRGFCDGDTVQAVKELVRVIRNDKEGRFDLGMKDPKTFTMMGVVHEMGGALSFDAPTGTLWIASPPKKWAGSSSLAKLARPTWYMVPMKGDLAELSAANA